MNCKGCGDEMTLVVHVDCAGSTILEVHYCMTCGWLTKMNIAGARVFSHYQKKEVKAKMIQDKKEKQKQYSADRRKEEKEKKRMK